MFELLLVGFGINAARRRVSYPEVKPLKLNDYNRMTPISNVKVVSISSAGYTGFTQSVVVITVMKS